ncbi:ABC transporter substrate-binding protein [Candidatus Halobonum tyrrellensis]|uniref:Ferrichrome-binding protein n=1 Tax=Candidatus Halobonum tyrrellensis G22 TaxID=1324957 RepID=V4GWM9_9EURY|nr:ABC transporter substrate-binding protein [Candidatus Halobonum tyrrellensis]ESP89576.1 ferrichrome-binding protein [Candidatus Halobonum tyrrellensis G22]
MPTDGEDDAGPTRREYVKYGGAVVGAGLFAGCSSDAGGSSTPTDAGATATPTETDTATGTTASTGTETADGGSYSVTMSPMGTVEFDGVPETVLAGGTNYMDAAAAVGHGDALESATHPTYAVPSLEYYYGALDVPTDWIDFTDAGGYNKETLYELDSDVHFVDPVYLSTVDGWGESDVREVEENVGPLFGNMYSRKHRQPPESYDGSYEYYTVWEMAETYAELFRETERFAQLHRVREDLVSHVESNLPPEGERPRAAMVYPRVSENSFYVHKLNQPGYFFAHTRPLGAVDVFADIETDEYGGKLVDYEAMLETDPDVIVMNHGISGYYDVPEVKAAVADHSVGSELAAVENDRFYASGNPRQGPVMSLFQLEMTAKQFYPERFGEWPGYAADGYPEIPEEERLFDRERLAAVVAGDA